MNSDFTLMDEFQESVLDVIKSVDIISGKDLAGVFGMNDTRKVRIAIQQLRLQGYPICIAPSSGYFYSEDKEDIDYTVNQLLKRANELMDVSEGMMSGVAS